jgi:hypothetical protein
VATSSRDYFDSSRFRGVVPFLEQLVWRGVGIKYAWKGVWRHLVFMEDELVVLTPPGPPSSDSLSVQLEEARTVKPLAGDDVWATVPYANIVRVRVEHGRSRSMYTRLIVKTNRPDVLHWKEGPRSDLVFDFGLFWGHFFDPAKLTLAKSLIPEVLPKSVKLVGFRGLRDRTR